jgi:hypothetical protein
VTDSLPVVRSHERMTHKRCPRQWYWKWRRGLVPKRKAFGALDLGTWVHNALEGWYVPGSVREGTLYMHFNTWANLAIQAARREGAPAEVLDKAEELACLGEAMCKSYEAHYGQDDDIEVLGTEIPLEFTFPDHRGRLAAKHLLKPDMVVVFKSTGQIWVWENKTAASLHGCTEHLVIDDQARPYGAMAERALKEAGVIGRKDEVQGIMYNFMRKAFPDERWVDAEGRALNKNGTVSKKQPAPLFLRHPVRMTVAAKRITLSRLRAETLEITALAQAVRRHEIDPMDLKKTPHKSCPKFCDYFAMCASEEGGGNIALMEKSMYRVENPYTYGGSTDDPKGWDLG